MALPLGLIRKTPAAATGTPTTPAAAPRLPSQGHTQDDDEGNIPPPPTMPDGEFRCRTKSVYHPVDKDTGKPQTWPDGTRKQSTLYFVISDPNEQRKANAGKSNCFGVDLKMPLDFGMFYQRTITWCAALGAPQMTWPKNEKGNTTVAMLGEHLLAVTKGKEFLVTAKTAAGKGDKKAQLYTNVTKIAPHTPPKAPPKAAPPLAPTQGPDETATEESTGADPDTSTTSNAESDGIPF